MPRSLLIAFVLAGLVSVGCSLRSLDELNRCAGQPISTDCPAPEGQGGGDSGAGGGPPGAGRGGGGAAGDATVEAGAAGVGEAPELVVLYADHSSTDPEPISESKSIRPIFVVRNTSAAPVEMSELSIRYYLTLESPTTLVFECDYVRPDAVVNDCAGIMAAFGTLPSSDRATHFLELTFAPPDDASWSIPELGGESGPVVARFYKENFSVHDQRNDYSFDASKVEVPELWDRVTLYRSGELIYGVEP